MPDDRANVPRTALKWEDWNLFRDDTTKLAIKITRAVGNGGKLFFSCQIGRMKSGYDKEEFTPFLTPKVTAEGLKVTAVLPDLEVLSTLADQAELVIEQALTQARNDERFERERAVADRAKPKARPGLKTLSKADAEKRNA
jgi:hypothetical protein